MKALAPLVLVPLLAALCVACGHEEPKTVNKARVLSDSPTWKEAARQVEAGLPKPSPEPKRALYRGSGRQKTVALTFDDGPHYLSTPEVLQILKESQVKAAFFVTGRMALRHPDLIRRIAAEGHTLGNHSFSHANLSELTPAKMTTEYRAAQIAVKAISGVVMKWARPPGGEMNDQVTEAALANGLTTALWDVAPRDYEEPEPDVLIQRILRWTRPGSIILLHEWRRTTRRSLPRIISELRARGFSFVTLEELAREGSSVEAARALPPSSFPARSGGTARVNRL